MQEVKRARFVRESADVRRQALMEATARCLAEKGVAGTSVRAICERAGVSPGLLTHYFPGVDALMLATYVYFGTKVHEALDAATEQAGPDPRARLLACLRANFLPPVLEPGLAGAWIAFWGLVSANGDFAAARADGYGGVQGRLERLLREAAPQASDRTLVSAAIMLTALVSGLWLRLSLTPLSFTIAEAQAMIEVAMDRALEDAKAG